MEQKYLVVESENIRGLKDREILYFGEGSFQDWRSRVHGELSIDRAYGLNEIGIGEGNDGTRHLIIRSYTVDPSDHSRVIDPDSVGFATVPINNSILANLSELLQKARSDQDRFS